MPIHEPVPPTPHIPIQIQLIIYLQQHKNRSSIGPPKESIFLTTILVYISVIITHITNNISVMIKTFCGQLFIYRINMFFPKISPKMFPKRSLQTPSDKIKVTSTPLKMKNVAVNFSPRLQTLFTILYFPLHRT